MQNGSWWHLVRKGLRGKPESRKSRVAATLRGRRVTEARAKESGGELTRQSPFGSSWRLLLAVCCSAFALLEQQQLLLLQASRLRS
jgi:hypothetical protein